MNEINRSITTRRLVPESLQKPGPWKTLHDKGIAAYTIEMNEIYEKNKIASRKKDQDRLNYLMKIEYDQGRDNRMWPYDLAKRLSLSEDTLQMCRQEDHLFDYDRENYKSEYNPEYYYDDDFQEYDDYPEYDNFCDFIDDDDDYE